MPRSLEHLVACRDEGGHREGLLVPRQDTGEGTPRLHTDAGLVIFPGLVYAGRGLRDAGKRLSGVARIEIRQASSGANCVEFLMCLLHEFSSDA